jgi:hypothetical protein
MKACDPWPVRPAPNEPGTLQQQLMLIAVAIYLGEKRGTNSRLEWQDARRLVIPHAGEALEQ